MTERRFTGKPELAPWAVRGLAPDHPAMRENRTLFPSTVVTVTDDTPDRLLVSGVNNRKLGSVVAKGAFKGYALYGLSLEERATCPADCALRNACYGNGMQMARRHRIGDPDVFYDRLGFEILELLDEHEDGLLVRLHVLGDFPSVEYVAFWADALAENPKLACYGYTRRRTTAWGGDEIGDAIEALKEQYPDRFRIRWSSEVSRPDGAVVIGNVPKTPRIAEGIVCPAQTEATACCASCGLCWEPNACNDTIVFIKHGPKSDAAAAAVAMVAQRALEPKELGEGGEAALAAESPAVRARMIRHVAPIQTAKDVKPAPVSPDLPKFQLVAPTSLLIEEAYQRELSPKSLRLIRKIVEGWDWAKFKPPVCAESPDGLFVIDGQHTAIAAATHPEISLIPVIVTETAALAERAAAFVSQNRDRLHVSAFTLLYADAAAGNETARKALALAEKTGAIIPRSEPGAGRAKAGTIVSIDEVRRALGAGDEAVIERIFRIAVMIEGKPLSRMVFRALRMVLTADIYRHVARLKDSTIANAMEDHDILNEMARERAAQTGEPNVRACASLIAEACAEAVVA